MNIKWVPTIVIIGSGNSRILLLKFWSEVSDKQFSSLIYFVTTPVSMQSSNHDIYWLFPKFQLCLYSHQCFSFVSFSTEGLCALVILLTLLRTTNYKKTVKSGSTSTASSTSVDAVSYLIQNAKVSKWVVLTERATEYLLYIQERLSGHYGVRRPSVCANCLWTAYLPNRRSYNNKIWYEIGGAWVLDLIRFPAPNTPVN